MSKLLVVVFLFLGFGTVKSPENNPSLETLSPSNPVNQPSKSRIIEAKNYVKKNGLDTAKCIFIDMKVHSGRNRLFVYDFQKQSVIKSALCAHGSGKGNMDGKIAQFSNVPESHCSSIGKYKIGKRGWSNWGVHFNYKLHGLESTNSNAYDRFIVLHAYEYVDDAEIYPEYLVTSWGCPMVSNNTLLYLDKVLKSTQKPVLMWIYN